MIDSRSIEALLPEIGVVTSSLSVKFPSVFNPSTIARNDKIKIDHGRTDKDWRT